MGPGLDLPASRKGAGRMTEPVARDVGSECGLVASAALLFPSCRKPRFYPGRPPAHQAIQGQVTPAPGEIPAGLSGGDNFIPSVREASRYGQMTQFWPVRCDMRVSPGGCWDDGTMSRCCRHLATSPGEALRTRRFPVNQSQHLKLAHVRTFSFSFFFFV